mgnify:CR=1 FL=1
MTDQQEPLQLPNRRNRKVMNESYYTESGEGSHNDDDWWKGWWKVRMGWGESDGHIVLETEDQTKTLNVIWKLCPCVENSLHDGEITKGEKKRIAYYLERNIVLRSLQLWREEILAFLLLMHLKDEVQYISGEIRIALKPINVIGAKEVELSKMLWFLLMVTVVWCRFS